VVVRRENGLAGRVVDVFEDLVVTRSERANGWTVIGWSGWPAWRGLAGPDTGGASPRVSLGVVYQMPTGWIWRFISGTVTFTGSH
jgi:hypothetical protein